MAGVRGHLYGFAGSLVLYSVDTYSDERASRTDQAFEPSSEQWALLSQVVREVSRGRGMPPEDAEDFEQTVMLKVVERRFDIFLQFRGLSSLRTYLRVVVARMLLDWQNQRYGKWRPSAAAVRLGEYGVALDRLINRDGYTVDQAVTIVETWNGAPSARTLHRTAAQIPRRLPPRRMLSHSLQDEPMLDFDDPLQADERERHEARLHETLALAVSRLSSDDRRLLALRYEQERSVREVADMMNTDAKALYRRYERLLRGLSRTFAEHGFTRLSLADAT